VRQVARDGVLILASHAREEGRENRRLHRLSERWMNVEKVRRHECPDWRTVWIAGDSAGVLAKAVDAMKGQEMVIERPPELDPALVDISMSRVGGFEARADDGLRGSENGSR
jgi:hypothetical protein